GQGALDYMSPEDVEPALDADGRIVGGRSKLDGQAVEYGGVGKMSKSEKNGVDSQEVIDRYGADTARHFVMFAGPPNVAAVWSDAGVEGSYRFLKRLWTFTHAKTDVVSAAVGAFAWSDADDAVKAARREVHLALRQANY